MGAGPDPVPPGDWYGHCGRQVPVKIGVVFPQTEMGAEVASITAYAEGVKKLGFSHVLAHDHVLGADPAVHQGWNGPYDIPPPSMSQWCCSDIWERSGRWSW